MRALITLAATLLVTAVVAGDQAAAPRAAAAGPSGLTTAQIEKPTTDAWVTYNGDYSGRRFSKLNKINAGERQAPEPGVDLRLAGGRHDQGDAAPDWRRAVLHDAEPRLRRRRAHRARSCGTTPSPRSRGGIQIGNRGVAILGDTVYFVTTDCNLVALDIKTGTEKWAKEFCSLEMMYYGSVAPVVVKDKLILGPSGDDLDVPAYLDARSPENGDLIWRWYVTPQKEGDPGLDTWPNLDMAKHGGGMTWQPVTYDPELNLIYVTTGNPAAGGGLQEPRRAPTCSPRRSWR